MSIIFALFVTILKTAYRVSCYQSYQTYLSYSQSNTQSNLSLAKLSIISRLLHRISTIFYFTTIINNYWMRFFFFSTLIILDITKTESNNCFIIH